MWSASGGELELQFKSAWEKYKSNLDRNCYCLGKMRATFQNCQAVVEVRCFVPLDIIGRISQLYRYLPRSNLEYL